MPQLNFGRILDKNKGPWPTPYLCATRLMRGKRIVTYTRVYAAAVRKPGFYDRRVEAPRSVLRGEVFIDHHAPLNVLALFRVEQRVGYDPPKSLASARWLLLKKATRGRRK
jgi:hypothetical protein